MTGKVKSWNDGRGFGFIVSDGHRGDVFAHYSNVLMNGFKTLKLGQRVEYDVYETPKGLEAKNIRVIE